MPKGKRKFKLKITTDRLNILDSERSEESLEIIGFLYLIGQ